MIIRPRVKHRGKVREGKGFSRAELKEVGLSTLEARKIGIPVDFRRKSCREENLRILKTVLEVHRKVKISK
jgi:large subunit ribosomal protein L13e